MLEQGIQRFTTSVGSGKNMLFSVENKWWLLIIMTLYFGSGFYAHFFIVRHQLLKKHGCLIHP
uniref:Cytochrome c oxidase subunit 7C, mitochondrial n=1 Tax=Nomascus leucogenys TaxID=61853 RepID=A0A2I3GHV7_NOMLE